DSVHQNTSPIWHTRRPNVPGHLSDTLFNYPVWNVCEWKDYSINQSAFEYQGDSVVYELVDFHQDSFLVNGSLLTYSAPYADTFVIPFDTSKPLFIDPNTGIVSYSPVTPPNLSSTGNLKLFQFAIKATEYRYDSFLVSGNMVWEARPMGYLIRNIQTITTDSSLCPEPNPFGSASSQSISDLNCNDSLIEFDLKKNIICASMDADASCFHMIDTITNDTIALDSAWIQDCFRSGEGYKVRIRPVMPLPYGVYWLTFKVGNDSNTAISSCQVGIKPYNDTLILVLDSIPTGVMLGDYIFGTTYDNKVTLICRSTKFLINLSEEVNCSSISGNFSDFLLVNNSVSPPDSVPISLISPLGCNDNSTSQIEVTSSNPFNPGLYTLYLIKGSDGNTLLTNCGEEWPLMSIPIQVEGFSISLGPDRVFCLGQTVAALLTAPSGFSSYKWSTGSSSRNLWVYSPGTYWVEVVDFDGCPGTDTIQVKQISCVGIESSSIDGFNVYPNPFHDQIFVSHGTIKTADIEILTIYGKLLLQHNNFPMGEGLEIGHYPAGIYFLKVTNGSEVILKKLVKE
ncbi:MAG: T9SS type A sorting domain-containing protein, partial [Vicingaceae bacterium]